MRGSRSNSDKYPNELADLVGSVGLYASSPADGVASSEMSASDSSSSSSSSANVEGV